MEEDVFVNEFTDVSADRRALVMKDAPDGSCILLGADNQCRTNSAKPRQCREFPFTWRNENSANICPGLTVNG